MGEPFHERPPRRAHGSDAETAFYEIVLVARSTKLEKCFIIQAPRA